MDVVSGTPSIDLTPFDRWDTFPPERGRIVLRVREDPTHAVAGDFRVVLSFGPERGYTLAPSIPAYAANGIPVFVGDLPGASAADPLASRADAEAAALAIGAPASGAIILWCGDLLLEVGNLRPVQAEDVDEAAYDERIDAIESLVAAVEPVDRLLAPEEKRPLYEGFLAMELPEDVVGTLVFVLEQDGVELELSRNEVLPEHLDAYRRAYAVLPTWDLRCALAYVLQDQSAAELADLRRDVLRAPTGQPLSVRHIAQATSLAWLQGRLADIELYLDDPDLLAREVRRWLEADSQP